MGQAPRGRIGYDDTGIVIGDRPKSPNTIADLLAKRNELAKLRDQMEDDIRSLALDIDHLEVAIGAAQGAQRPLNAVRALPPPPGFNTPDVPPFGR